MSGRGRAAPSRSSGPGRGQALLGLALLALGLSAAGAGIEPFATWCYQFSWAGYLLAADGLVKIRQGHSLLRDRRRALPTLLAVSVAVWVLFECLNLRLRNWIYLEVPSSRPLRWVGYASAFATVLPLLFVTAELLWTTRLLQGVRSRPFRVSRSTRAFLVATGLSFLVLPLAWPRAFFPLVWGALVLIAEPILEATGGRSLLAELARGRPRRTLLLLASGLVAGFFWECFNAVAKAGWTYTIPHLDSPRLFEMPLAGFLGFPPFVLECYAVYNLLVRAGLAVPWHGDGPEREVDPPVWARALFYVGLAVFVGVGFDLIDRHTVSRWAGG